METDSKLDEIVDEALKRDIRVELDWNNERNERMYRVYGFSKSDSVNLLVNRNAEEVEAHARYNEVTVLETFYDLAQLAFDWFRRYKDTQPFDYPDHSWEPVFVEMGWIKLETVTSTKVTIL